MRSLLCIRVPLALDEPLWCMNIERTIAKERFKPLVDSTLNRSCPGQRLVGIGKL
jgi:hypothetical protein